MIEMGPGTKSRKLSDGTSGIVKAIAACVGAVVAGEPVSGSVIISKAIPGLVEAALAISKGGPQPLSVRAWGIVRSSLAIALTKFFATVPLERRPLGRELELLIAALLNRADILSEDQPQSINEEHLISPLKILVLRDFSRALPHELSMFKPSSKPDQSRRLFEQCVYEALAEVRNSKPELFAEIELAMSGTFSRSQELYAAAGRHEQFLIRSFSQKSVFGQELTGITLSQLYVKQRCIWKTQNDILDLSPEVSLPSHEIYDNPILKKEPTYTLHLNLLHETLSLWLGSNEVHDSVRVVAGGPGSGKSTFAKAFAIEVIDSGNFDVLFIPLQDLSTTGSFETRVENLLSTRSELGFDRIDCPLKWMGKPDIDGVPPQKKLLLVCDGLDELAAPDSKEAANITTDFIQTLRQWLNNRNSNGICVKALILGRTISAEEAFSKLDVDTEALIRVAGLLPIESSAEWKTASERKHVSDLLGLSGLDQRVTYWKHWCLANGTPDVEAPSALDTQDHAAQGFVELTAEPLLLYLLIWTGFLGERWREASENRNIVYLEMFKRIYSRDWGAQPRKSGSSNKQRGGHASLHHVSEEDFFLLQETLGLASWASGGRTVSAGAFLNAKKAYLTEDQMDDLDHLFGSSLKSVALQSYTRSVDGSDEGYEFVHKSLGEYLIGRAVAGCVERAIMLLNDRITDSRCKSAALIVASICSTGSLTREIDRFLLDEIRLRFKERKAAKVALEVSIIPLINWVLRHGVPVHEVVDGGNRTDFSDLVRGSARATDGLWTVAQHLAKQSYRILRLPNNNLAGYGPLPVDWPSFSSFSSLFSTLTDRTFVAETGRIPQFDFLDLTNQAVTEQDFGSIIYSVSPGEVAPRTWLSASLAGCDIRNAAFFMAHLREVNLRGALLHNAELSQSCLARSNLSDADLTGAMLNDANLDGAILIRSKLHQAKLGGGNWEGVNAEGADMEGAEFVSDRTRKSSMTYIGNCNFTKANLRGVNFGDAHLEQCDFTDANLSQASFVGAFLEDGITLNGADLRGCRFTEEQVNRLDLAKSQVNVIVVEGRAN